MEFSCHTLAFTDLTLPEALGTIARLGFRYVDLGSGEHLNLARAGFPNTRDAVVEEIRQDLETFNLQLSDLYLLLPRISLADEKKRKTDIALFKALIPFVKALASPGITLSAGLLHPEDDIEAIDRTIAALREMLAAASDEEIAISIEPQIDTMVQTPEHALKFLKEVPGLQLTLDWAHMAYQDIPHDKIVELLPQTRHIHIRQAARAQMQLPFARGRINVSKVMKALKDIEYSGTICVEYMQPKDQQGAVQVQPIRECVTMRDALREARDSGHV